MSYESDREEILRLHTVWWTANMGLDIPAMRTVFPPGDDQYLMYNLNTHPYYNLTEKTALWEYYSDKITVLPSDIWVQRLDIDGDMAYLACEGVWHAQREGDTEAKDYPVRATEVYRRNDGEGGTAWKMWHFHCSQAAKLDAPRPAFGDTFTSRGVGHLPSGGSFRSLTRDA